MYKYSILSLLLLLFSGTLKAGQITASSTLNIVDSMLTEKYIRETYLSTPNRALQLLDEAEERRLPGMPLFRIDMLRSTIYESQAMYTLKERYVRRALQSDSVLQVPARRLRVLAQLATTLDRLNKYEQGISVCTEAIDLAQQLGQRAMESELLFTIGRIYNGMKASDKALEYMLRSIDLLKGTDNVRELAQLSTSYGDLSTFYHDHGQTDKAIETTLQRIEIVRRMSTMQGPPKGYIDQQYGYLYSKLAYFYQRTGQTQQAAEAYAQYQSTDFSHSPHGASQIIPYLQLSGQYWKALDVADYIQQYLVREDTISYEYLVALNRYAQLYRSLKEPALADAYQQRVTVLTDSIYAREKQSQAHEFAVIYQTREKDQLLKEEREKVFQQRLNMAMACMTILLLSIMLWEQYVNLRRTRESNRIAAMQIDELLAQQEELRKAYAEMEKERVDKEDTPLPSTLSEETRRRFMQMENALLTDRLFLSPQLCREDLMRLSGLSKNRVGAFIQECTGENINGYINRLRVEYSVSLLKQAKDTHSIDAIANDSGFNSRNVYYTAFKKRFGISPAQYKEGKKE